MRNYEHFNFIGLTSTEWGWAVELKKKRENGFFGKILRKIFG